MPAHPDRLQQELDCIVGQTIRQFSASDPTTLAAVEADDRRMLTSSITNRYWKNDVRTWPIEEQVALVQECQQWYGRATIEGENILALNTPDWEEALSERMKHALQASLEAFLERVAPTSESQATFTDDLLLEPEWEERDAVSEDRVLSVVDDLTARVKKKDHNKQRDFAHDITVDHEMARLWTPAAQAKAVRILASEYKLSSDRILNGTQDLVESRWDELIPQLVSNALTYSILAALESTDAADQ